MLSIGAMRGGQQNYYLELAREDYYLQGGEPPGIWHGRGAADLGLHGEVDGDALTRLFAGYHPTEERSLIQRQNYGQADRKHRPGWDFSFSAPKSVSVLWSQADAATRQEIEKAHFAAVQSALNYLEEEEAITRRGRGGREKLEARLIIACFEHHTSRAQDPQLHTHALVLNACLDERGGGGTVESRPLYLAKMAGGAVYRAELAVQLEERLELAMRRRGVFVEVDGVPKEVIDEFSKRRAAIEKALAVAGYSSAAAAAKAALNTRDSKDHLPQEELFPQWHRVGEEQGWGRAQAARLLQGARLPERHLETEMEIALQRAGERITAGESHFSRRDFTRTLAEECQGRGLGATALRAARDQHLGHSEDIVRLGRHKRELAYTTKEMMETEKALLACVERGRQEELAGVSSATVEGVIATRRVFAEEQAQALRHITENGGRVRVVSGVAGSGKTTLLHAARLAFELEGFEVHGAALASKAAGRLEQGSGIASTTLTRTLMDLESQQLQLHAKSVLVVDEAGMVGTRTMRRLAEEVEKAGARLVLVGERNQIQPIEAGGPFAAIEDKLGSAKLQEIRRQDQVWARQAVQDLAQGQSAAALRAYAQRGLVTVTPDRRGAMQALIEAWKGEGVRDPKGQFILAGTRLETAILNRLAQDARRQAGWLSPESAPIPGGNEVLFMGDRVLFTRNSKLYGVRNGDQGTVMGLDPATGTLTVRLDDGESVRFGLQDYAHIAPGYAMTTHKGQGATTKNAFILAGGAMQDREISYVQASRARGETRFFVDELEAGESLTQLVRQMAHSRAKGLAHALMQEPQEAHPHPTDRSPAPAAAQPDRQSPVQPAAHPPQSPLQPATQSPAQPAAQPTQQPSIQPDWGPDFGF